MKKILFIALIAIAHNTYAQDVIREWNFNDSLKTAVGNTDSIRVIGEISSVIKRTTAASKNFILYTSAYPAKDQKNLSQGLEFTTSTKGFTQIQLSTTLKFSSTAANTWIVQTCLNRDAPQPEWLNVDTLGPFTKSSSNIQTLSNLSNNLTINDKTSISFRLVASFAIGSSQYIPISATSYSTKGTVQFDNIILKGVKKISNTCPEANIKSSNISITNQTGFAGLLKWQRGNGDSTLILISESATLSQIPENGKSYTNSSYFGKETTKIGNAYVLSNSNIDSTVVRNLRPGKIYYVFAFETYCTPIKYTTTPAQFNFTTPASDEHPELYINELMADNSVTIKDDRELYSDWIELYTPNSFYLDLTGYFLSNDPSNLTKCYLKENIVESKKDNSYYAVLWADGTTTQSCQHLNFELRKDGGKLFITAPDSVTIIDSISYPALIKDETFQRNGDAATSWIKSSTATPLAANISKTVAIEQFQQTELKIWPNPIKRGDILQLSKEQYFEIYNSTGIVITPFNKYNSINTSNLQKGIYHLKFKNGAIKPLIVL